MPSLRSRAVHLVSDLTTVILNPISDEPSKPPVCSPFFSPLLNFVGIVSILGYGFIIGFFLRHVLIFRVRFLGIL